MVECENNINLNNKLELSLENFQGPLDLLLHFVREEKIEIKDIFLSSVTDQFLKFISSVNIIDVDRSSEYMEITATLMEIKSRAMLPMLPVEEDEETPEQEIIRRLEEFRIIKEASEELKKNENIDRLYKQPSDTGRKLNFVSADMSLTALTEAFIAMMVRINTTNEAGIEVKEVLKDNYTIADKIDFIKDKLNGQKRISFFELFKENATKNEIVVTFSALLELIKLQYLTVMQNNSFSDIIIKQI